MRFLIYVRLLRWLLRLQDVGPVEPQHNDFLTTGYNVCGGAIAAGHLWLVLEIASVWLSEDLIIISFFNG